MIANVWKNGGNDGGNAFALSGIVPNTPVSTMSAALLGLLALAWSLLLAAGGRSRMWAILIPVLLNSALLWGLVHAPWPTLEIIGVLTVALLALCLVPRGTYEIEVED